MLFGAFKGVRSSDSPRAVREELMRRGVPFEHLWVVKDGQADVPAAARAVRMRSPEWYEVLATGRYVVANNHLPDWFRKRPGRIGESGHPRNDVLRCPGAERLAAGVRRRIGIPDGRRVVPSAPTAAPARCRTAGTSPSSSTPATAPRATRRRRCGRGRGTLAW
ncbi:CDP-glycerol glycerophosphotransferase family protein [Kitasatospora sp. NA04385]|uniref:CDP-glycerol glycerophosphotransferase family protein n=1 Tax=Kitasatospora sp. NA04385 TaxID=2742135 RepID=UPI0020CB3632|nr:CDP-glycerol glycerophosphotransferase family protein [Kitasatospora sp. NA04385]